MHNIRLVILGLCLYFNLLSAQGDVEKLPLFVNSDLYDETTPILSSKGDMLFFTRTAYPDFEASIMAEDGQVTSRKNEALYKDRLAGIYSQIAGKKISDPFASSYNQDIWFSPILDDSLGESIHPGYPLNNALPNSLVSNGMSPDEYVIINQFYSDGSMYAGFSRVNITMDGEHSFPAPMYIYEFNVSGSNVNMAMTRNGHVVILSMERSDSKGQNDFYVSFFVRDNVWSAPIHMGEQINTAFQETTPYISPDKRFLYFSSNRPGGIGGNDIYVSERLDYSWLRWSSPVLVGGDVNSEFDDSQPYFDPAANYMYFSSRRDGSSDIFRKRLTPKPRLKKPIFIKGKIIDVLTGKPTRSELFWGQHSSKDYLEYFNSYNGHFEMTLTEYEPYKFQPRKPNHTAQRILVDPRGVEKHGKDTIEVILYIEPLEMEDMVKDLQEQKMITELTRGHEMDKVSPNTIISFYDIRFSKGKATMLKSSDPALQYLSKAMIDNPGMEIAIEGHTDNVGDESALIDLSHARAEAIRNYLVRHGIAKERILVSGVGATRPLFLNATEEGREKNRRVEIRCIKMGG